MGQVRLGVRAGLMVLGMVASVCAQAQTSQARPEVSAVSAPRPVIVAATPSAVAGVLRPIASALIAYPRTISVPGAPGSVATIHLTAQDLYYSGDVPAEFFQPQSAGQLEHTAAFGLDLHIPGMRSLISMGGGDVEMSSSSMMGMARSAGIAEARLDLASLGGRFTLRIQGRALCARSATFVTPLFSTENWLVTEKPSINAAWHF